jgi:hypothetical protein
MFERWSSAHGGELPLPLFEVEGDRPHIVPPHGPSVSTTAHRVVESHIDALLGEQVFPVASGTGPDEPHLIALDAAGAPVVVEVVARLDDDALSRALGHGGAAGRMTRTQLGELYGGGPAAFQRDVAQFFDSVPVTRTQAGRNGVRLIVICQDADDDVLNAVDFLRQPAMPVEVLRLGVVNGADGRRFIDVSPLAICPASAPDRPTVMERPEGVAELTALGAQVVGTVSAPAPSRTGGEPPVRRRSRTDRFTSPAAVDPVPAPAVPAPAVPAPDAAAFAPMPPVPVEPWHGSDDVATTTYLPPASQEPSRLPHDLTLEPALSADDALAWRPSPRDWDAPLSGGRAPEPEPERHTSSTPMVLDESADGDLERLARRIGVTTALVWERRRRGQRFDAVLHPDGTIELADNGRYFHPDVAAAAASGSYSADGWTVWRLVSTGESLAEAFRSHFA